MKLFKNLLLLVLTSVSVLSLAACDDEVEEAVVSKFEISNDTFKFDKIGQEAELIATVDGEEVDATVTFGNDNVVSYKDNTLTALENGSTNIFFNYGNFDELVCVVTVDTSFAIVTSAETTNFLDLNATFDLEASVTLPSEEYTEDGIVFTTSDSSIATVSEDGIVTGVSMGIAIITITSVLEIEYEVVGQGGGTSTKLQKATTDVTFMIGNEWDSTTHASLIGTYEATFDWLGFGSKSGTFEEAGMVRAYLTLEIYADGTYKQTLLNAKRAAYTFDEENLTFTNAHTYNRLLQSSELDEAVTMTINGTEYTFDFLSFTGYELSGISNFTEEGTVYINEGELSFVYPPRTTNPVTQIRNLGEWQTAFNTPYKPLENSCVFHEDMTMLLTKKTA